MTEPTDTNMRVLVQANDVDAHLLTLVVSCVEDWFPDGPLDTGDFIDRLCDNYLNAEGYDVESLMCPAANKIMRKARETKREMA